MLIEGMLIEGFDCTCIPFMRMYPLFVHLFIMKPGCLVGFVHFTIAVR